MNRTTSLSPRKSQARTGHYPPVRERKDIVAWLEAEARTAGITTSEAVRQIIATWLREKGHDV